MTYPSNNNGAANTFAVDIGGLRAPAQLVAFLEVALGCDPRGRRHHHLRHYTLAVNARERRCRDTLRQDKAIALRGLVFSNCAQRRSTAPDRGVGSLGIGQGTALDELDMVQSCIGWHASVTYC
jgi:hypothetical protein